ncbi:MAG: PAS domain S-box protein [Syntrophaceae bacterium]|nr:PAS domain S-box protein [Syntrophaceae bacterium]
MDDSVDGHSDETTRKKTANSGKAADVASSDLQALVHRLEQEIAERRRAENALRESEELYRRAFEQSNDGIVITQNGRYVFVNQPFLRTVGRRMEDLLDKTLGAFVHPDDRERLADYTRRRRVGEPAPSNYGLRIIKPDGTLVHVDINVIEVVYRGEKAFLGYLRDITEKKRADERLRESEDRYRRLVQFAPAGIYQVDFQSRRFIDVNDVMCHYTGYTREEFLALDPLQIIAEDSLELFLKRAADIMAGIPISDKVEYKVRGKNGREFWVLLHNSFFHEGGKPVVSTVIVHDITERRQAEQALRDSEERYRTLVETSPDSILLYSLTGEILTASGQTAAMYGASSTAQFMKEVRTVFDLLTDEGREKAAANFSRTLAKGHSEKNEYRIRLRDGSQIDAEINSSLVRDASGEPQAFISVVRDITDRKRAEEERDRLQMQLLQAQKMESVGRLAGGVAHDFNNILAAIMGYAEMSLLLATPGTKVHQNLQEILKAAGRSADLTGQLLAFARRQVTSPKVLNLNDTVGGMLKMLRRLIGEDIDLAWIPGHDLWSVKIDASQVDQMLANLLVNARDAISGAGRVTIETRNVEVDEGFIARHGEFSPGDYVLLSVSDTGCGIDRETLEHVFEPFFTTKEVGKGTGLGLAMVFGIVRQNEGFIHAYSEPRQGTTFRIYLPRVASARPEQSQPGEAVIPRRGEETILLAEDDEAVLTLTRSVLEALGYRVITAGSPDRAIQVVGESEETIHLLLTDVVMPGMNGRDLAERLVSLRPGLKCLFMSGYPADVIAHHGILEEGIHFVQKPFSIQALSEAVRRVLDEG